MLRRKVQETLHLFFRKFENFLKSFDFFPREVEGKKNKIFTSQLISIVGGGKGKDVMLAKNCVN